MPDEVRDDTFGEGQGVSEEDESKNNGMMEDLTDCDAAQRDEALLNGRASEQVEQQPPLTPPGPNIRWERFLPVRSLKVLLVEYDDSTRQVVSALLRNCSYEVIAASNGLQAWNILEDLTNHVDLVLTEVVMPGLSGIGLLSKIMCHKTCKNTPVIMMSSNDSMGIVFKCLSKGAVDFLVKPIRKNELKNLWQHVWRRCHSSSGSGSGSGSESGIQNKKFAKSKSEDESDDNTASTDEDDNGSVGLDARDGSDNGSGTQSSWTKRAVEVESPQPLSPSDQLADPHDSTCALVIHPKSEHICSQWVPMNAQKDAEEQKDPNDDHIMGKDLEIGMPNPVAQNISYSTEQISANLTGAVLDGSMKDLKKDGIESGLEHESCKPNRQTAKQDAELIVGTTNASDADMRGRIADAPKAFCQNSECEDKTNHISRDMPSLELSLKRPRPNRVIHEDRTILRHSDHSAFTRYNSSAASNQAPEGHGGSSSIRLDNCSEAMKTESTYNMITSSNAPQLKQGSDGSSNDNDVGSTTKNISTKPATFKDNITITSTVNFIEPCNLDPIQNQASGSQQVTQEKMDDVEATAMAGPPTILKHQVQVQHHHHHYHHYHHHLHSRKQHQEQDGDDLSLQNNVASAPQCGSSNVLGGPREGIAANFSVNGSGSGSTPQSNGQNGSSVAVNTGVMHIDSDNGIGERSGSGGTRNGSGSTSGSGSGSGGSGLASNRFAQREAALNKFRQKRKERNFGKKVRYQSRKKLAEERPRIRGQFVKQVVRENTNTNCEAES